MTVFVPIKELESRLAALAARVEAGETVIVTRDGKPVFDWTPHSSGKTEDPAPPAGESVPDRKSRRINLERGWAYLREQGITNPVPYIADDFDDPLPEDFLLRPLPRLIDATAVRHSCPVGADARDADGALSRRERPPG